MKCLSRSALVLFSVGLTACASTPTQVSAPQPVVVAPVLVELLPAQLLSAATATVETPVTLVPRFATEAEMKAAEARQNTRNQARQNNRQARRNATANNTTSTATATASVMPAAVQDAADQIDVGGLDELISYLVDKAGNYPPRFADRRERSLAESETKQMISALDPLVVQPNASFDLLIRAVQLNQVARNLDIGVQSAVKAGVYMRRAIALRPDDPTAQYWYGTMLTEGGGFREGIPYLNRAAQAGYKKAYLALAQAYLHIDQRPNALSALESYSIAVPEQQAATHSLIEQVRAGKTNIWSH